MKEKKKPETKGNAIPASLHLINEDKQLQEILPKLKQQEKLAVDIEFDNKRSNPTIICLLQIGSKTDQYLIDAISVDISVLKVIFEDAKVQKIFFGGIQDIQYLLFLHDIRTRNVYDISIAYHFFNSHGNRSLSLDGVIDGLLETKIPKSTAIQKGNWKQRPLPYDYLIYAANDVKYLIQCFNKIKNMGEKLDHKILDLHFAQIEFVEPMNENNQFQIFDIIKQADITDYDERVCLYEIMKLREQHAKKVGVNHGFVVSKSDLIKLMDCDEVNLRDLIKSVNGGRHLKPYSKEVYVKRMKYNQSKSRKKKVQVNKGFNNLQLLRDMFGGDVKYLDENLKWPFDVEHQEYNERRYSLNVLKKQLKETMGNSVNKLVSKYLVHKIGITKDFDFDEQAKMISESNNLDELATVVENILDLI